MLAIQLEIAENERDEVQAELIDLNEKHQEAMGLLSELT